MIEPPAQGISEALRDYLYGLTLHGIKLGLENIEYLLEGAGNPERRYPCVHVGGTNGKGSVLAFLHAMLQAAGHRAGRFTSPHIMDLAERFQVNGMLIPPEDLDENIAFVQHVAQGLPYPPTFFEACTAIAFRWFAQREVELGLIEVGMGGRLDSTNVIRPLAGAITNIDLEHTQYLGDTLEAIAFEKAGILKADVPFVVTEERPGPLGVIERRAQEAGARLMRPKRDFTFEIHGPPWAQRFTYNSAALSLHDVPLGLAGMHQGINAAAAVTLAEMCWETFRGLDERSIAQGLATASWPCRMERVLEAPPVIIDVAHNVAGAKRLVEAFEECVTILAVASDKNASGMIEVLAPISPTLILSVFDGKRALPLEDICAAAGNWPHLIAPDLGAAIRIGLERATNNRPLLITGSIYTAGEARRILVEHYSAPPLHF